MQNEDWIKLKTNKKKQTENEIWKKKKERKKEKNPNNQ